MSEYTKEELIQYRLKKAQQTFETAKHIEQFEIAGNSIANRLYYAAFYCVNALLAHKEIDYKSHKSVKTALSNFYIRTGLIDSSYGEMYNKLFEMRQNGDYSDYYDVSLETIKPYIERVSEFIKVVEKILAESDNY